MRSTICGTIREGDWNERQYLQLAFASVPARVGPLYRFIRCSWSYCLASHDVNFFSSELPCNCGTKGGMFQRCKGFVIRALAFVRFISRASSLNIHECLLCLSGTIDQLQWSVCRPGHCQPMYSSLVCRSRSWGLIKKGPATHEYRITQQTPVRPDRPGLINPSRPHLHHALYYGTRWCVALGILIVTQNYIPTWLKCPAKYRYEQTSACTNEVAKKKVKTFVVLEKGSAVCHIMTERTEKGAHPRGWASFVCVGSNK